MRILSSLAESILWCIAALIYSIISAGLSNGPRSSLSDLLIQITIFLVFFGIFAAVYLFTNFRYNQLRGKVGIELSDFANNFMVYALGYLLYHHRDKPLGVGEFFIGFLIARIFYMNWRIAELKAAASETSAPRKDPQGDTQPLSMRQIAINKLGIFLVLVFGSVAFASAQYRLRNFILTVVFGSVLLGLNAYRDLKSGHAVQPSNWRENVTVFGIATIGCALPWLLHNHHRNMLAELPWLLLGLMGSALIVWSTGQATRRSTEAQ